MQQYREIKSRHPHAILFFRMGDFYEMFEDDAKLAARELDLTLTTRNNGGANRVPLAGVPVKAADEYLRRLLDKGFRVAICEQVEDPKLAKGLVKRAVVETLTPGAHVAGRWLEESRNNYIVALNQCDTSVGLAAIDVSTSCSSSGFQKSAVLPKLIIQTSLTLCGSRPSSLSSSGNVKWSRADGNTAERAASLAAK